MKRLLCVLAVAVLTMNAGAEPLVKATGFGLPDAWVRKPFCGKYEKLRGGEVEKCGQRWLVWMFNNKGVTNYLDEEPVIDHACDAKVVVTGANDVRIGTVRVLGEIFHVLASKAGLAEDPWEGARPRPDDAVRLLLVQQARFENGSPAEFGRCDVIYYTDYEKREIVFGGRGGSRRDGCFCRA